MFWLNDYNQFLVNVQSEMHIFYIWYSVPWENLKNKILQIKISVQNLLNYIARDTNDL